jgi:hypothetical protein
MMGFLEEEFPQGKKGQTEHRTAQPPTLATFRSWGSSAGAGRAGLPGGKDIRIFAISDFALNISGLM